MSEEVVISEEKVIESKKKERGASLVEYALLVALIAIVCIVSVRTLGNTVSNQLRRSAVQLGG